MIKPPSGILAAPGSPHGGQEVLGAARRVAKPLLTLYGRPYCHLCDDMLAALEAMRGEFDFTVEVVDVDARPEWVELYNELVPVLTISGAEICHYFLDVDRLRNALQQASTNI